MIAAITLSIDISFLFLLIIEWSLVQFFFVPWDSLPFTSFFWCKYTIFSELLSTKQLDCANIAQNSVANATFWL